MINLLKKHTLFLLSSLCLLGCLEKKAEPDVNFVNEQDFQIQYSLPADWQTFETLDNEFGGKTVTVITSLGSFITVYSYPKNNTPEYVSVDYFTKKYLVASIPEGEARDAVRIDSGEVDRRQLTGQFFHAKAPEPFNADFVVEVYEIKKEAKNIYVVVNTVSSLIPELNHSIDLFLETIE